MTLNSLLAHLGPGLGSLTALPGRRSAAFASAAAAGVLAVTAALLAWCPALYFALARRSRRHPRLEDGTPLEPWTSPKFPFGNHQQVQALDPNEVIRLMHAVGSRQNGVVVNYTGLTPFVYIVDNDDAVKELLGAKVTSQNSVRPLGRVLPTWSWLFGRGLFMVSGEDWRRQKRIAMRGFGPRQLERFVAMVEDEVRDSFRRLEQAVGLGAGSALGKELGLSQCSKTGLVAVDPATMFKDMAVRVITAVAFGQGLDADDRDALLRSFSVFEDSARDPLFLVPGYLSLPVEGARRLRSAITELHRIGHEVVMRHRSSGEADKPDDEDVPQSLLTALMRARDDDGGCLSEEELVHNVFSFMGAGLSTTSDTLTTTSFLLARDEAVQRRLQAELDTATGWSDLMDKPYVSAVLTESMRLWPAVTSVPMRELLEDTTIAGIFIPKGCSILAHSLALQRAAVWGPDANEFRPERFLDDAALEKKMTPMACMPLPDGVPDTALTAFGGGVRPCIGRPLAMAEMKLALFNLLQRFSLVEIEPESFQMMQAVPIIYPKRGLLLGLRPR